MQARSFHYPNILVSKLNSWNQICRKKRCCQSHIHINTCSMILLSYSH
jgi:hypothetical protein